MFSYSPTDTTKSPFKTDSKPKRIYYLAAFIVGLLFFSFIMLQLFAGNDVSLEDNGDGGRLWCQHGLVPPAWSEVVWQPTVIDKPCSLDNHINPYAYPSSALALILASRTLHYFFTDGVTPFDIRWAGTLSAFLLGLIAATAVLVLPGTLLMRVLLVLTATLFWSDIGLLSYLNGYYAESAGFIATSLLILAVSYYTQTERHHYQAVWFLVFATLLAATIKMQMIVVFIPTLLLLLVVPQLHVQRSKIKCFIVPTLAIATIITVISFYANSFGRGHADINRYNMVFSAILVEAPSPKQALKHMGLPTSLSSYTATGFWPDDNNASQHPDFPIFQKKANRIAVLHYLINHPKIYVTMLARTIVKMSQFRVDYLSNFAGIHQLANRPAPVHYVLQLFGFNIWFILPIALITAIVMGLFRMYRYRHDAKQRTWWTLVWFQSSTVLLGLMVIPIGDGYYELAKHTTWVVWQLAPLLAALVVLIVYLITNAMLRTLFPSYFTSSPCER